MKRGFGGSEQPAQSPPTPKTNSLPSTSLRSITKQEAPTLGSIHFIASLTLSLENSCSFAARWLGIARLSGVVGWDYKNKNHYPLFVARRVLNLPLNQNSYAQPTFAAWTEQRNCHCHLINIQSLLRRRTVSGERSFDFLRSLASGFFLICSVLAWRTSWSLWSSERSWWVGWC